VGGGYWEIMADADWDPTVQTEIATGVAGAGTSATSFEPAAPLGVNDWRGYSVEWTTGDAVGFLRHVQWNEATEVWPSANWEAGSAPAPGDSYRIFRTNGCRLAIPPGYSAAFNYQLAQSMAGSSIDWDPTQLEMRSGELPAGAVIWDGVALEGAQAFRLGAGFHCAYGVESLGASTSSFFVSPGCRLMCGYGAGYDLFGISGGLQKYQQRVGWGMSELDRGPQIGTNAEVYGCLVQRSAGANGHLNTIPNAGSVLYQWGGTPTRVLGGPPGFARGKWVLVMDAGMLGNAPAPRGNFGGSVAIQLDASRAMMDAQILLRACTFEGMGAPIRVEGNATMEVEGAACSIAPSGGQVLVVRRAGRFFLNGAPTNIGGGSSSWNIDGTGYDPAVTFGSAGTAVSGSQGSLVARSA
jgi:hypothetical protein